MFCLCIFLWFEVSQKHFSLLCLGANCWQTLYHYLFWRSSINNRSVLSVMFYRFRYLELIFVNVKSEILKNSLYTIYYTVVCDFKLCQSVLWHQVLLETLISFKFYVNVIMYKSAIILKNNLKYICFYYVFMSCHVPLKADLYKFIQRIKK